MIRFEQSGATAPRAAVGVTVAAGNPGRFDLALEDFECPDFVRRLTKAEGPDGPIVIGVWKALSSSS